MDRKKGLYAWLSALFAMMAMPFVSAYGLAIDISRGPEMVINFVKDFTSPFFAALLNTSAYSEFFFAKVLLLILVFVVVYYVLRQSEFLGIQRQKGVLLIITSVVSILAMRYLPENDLINGILLPYNTLGLAITIFLPFLIYFFFVEKSVQSGGGRRFAWIIYMVIFGILWISRHSRLSKVGNYIYLAGLIVALFILMFDTSIHKYFQLSDFRRGSEHTRISNKIKLAKEWEEVHEAWRKKQISQSEFEREIKRITDAQERLAEEG